MENGRNKTTAKRVALRAGNQNDVLTMSYLNKYFEVHIDDSHCIAYAKLKDEYDEKSWTDVDGT